MVPSPPLESRRRGWLLVLLVPCVLGALRAAQLLTVAPSLFDGEFISFATFSQEVADRGSYFGAMSIGVGHLCYNAVQTGSLFVQLTTAALSLVMGPTIWALHAVAILCEMAGVGVLAWLLLRVGGRPAVLVGVLPWLLQPGYMVSWQLRPYGNHTEFLVIPLATAVFLTTRRLEERPLWHWLGPAVWLGAGVALYRLNLSVVVAFLAVCLLTRSRRAILAGAATSFLALVVALWGLVATCAQHAGSWRTVFPTLTLESGGIAENLRRLPSLFPAPAIGPSGLYLALLAAALLLAAGVAGWTLVTGRSQQRPLWFAVLWAAAAIAMVLPDGNQQMTHQFQAVFAVLLALGLLLGAELPRRIRLGAGSLAVGLALLCLADGIALIRPAAWASTTQYDGIALFRRLAVPVLDPDDVPRLQRMLEEGRLDAYPQLTGHFNTLSCGPVDLRAWRGGPAPDAVLGRCSCWEPGRLASSLDVDPGTLTEGEADALGRVLWVYCDRDLAALESALVGLDSSFVERILRAAKDEAGQGAKAP